MLSYILVYLMKLEEWECTIDKQISNQVSLREKSSHLPTSIIFLRICLNRSVKASDFFFKRLRPVWAPFKRAFMMVWALLQKKKYKCPASPKGIKGKKNLRPCQKMLRDKLWSNGEISAWNGNNFNFFISSNKLPSFRCKTMNWRSIQISLPSRLWRIFNLKNIFDLTKMSVAILKLLLCIWRYNAQRTTFRSVKLSLHTSSLTLEKTSTIKILSTQWTQLLPHCTSLIWE